MKNFDLELRVTTYGSILTWQVLLEDSTNPNMSVLDWVPAEGHRVKQLPDYRIKDDSLEVFLSCNGISGGAITCEVLINGELQENKVVARVEDKVYSCESYSV